MTFLTRFLYRTCLTLFLASGPAHALDLPRDVDGWSLLQPTDDSRIVYVSASHGDDATARAYASDEAVIGADPRQPVGTVAAFATIDASFAAVRDGEPDWVLLRAGDVWERGRLPLRSGRSQEAPFVIADYGMGTQRPLLRQGNSGAFHSLGNRTIGYLGYLIVTGIHFTNNAVDPADVSYDDTLNPAFAALLPGHTDIRHIDFEDCVFQFQQVNIQQWGDYLIRDIDFHRCQFLDSYRREGHSQGIFVSGTAVDIEECFFDHNGWLVQAQDGLTTSDGIATIFNHNFYVSSPTQMRITGNVLMRSASMHKFRSDTADYMQDLLVADNLILEGEVGLSIGGNTDEPRRFVYPVIRDNVLMDIGRTHPTNRSLAWYLGIQDWDGGLVENNYFLHHRDDTIGNAYGINVSGGTTRQVLIRDNIIHGFARGNGIILGDVPGPVTWFRNRVDFASPDAIAIRIGHADVVNGHRFYDNRWSDNHASGMLVLNQGGDDFDATAWASHAGSQGMATTASAYPDPERTVETYLASLGYPATMDEFSLRLRAQSRRNWDPAFTTAAVNAYIKAGFALVDDRPRRRLRVRISGADFGPVRAVCNRAIRTAPDVTGTVIFPNMTPREATRIDFEANPDTSGEG